MGGKDDLLEYRVDTGEWKSMTYSESMDPSFLRSVLAWDAESDLLQGRRPSNPENSKHLWTAAFPGGLTLGTHRLQVRATDRYGKMHTAEQEFEVQEPRPIP